MTIKFVMLWLCFLFCLLLILASSMSYDDAQAEEAFYCQMVKEKTWSDYKKIYEKACTNENE